jgi:MaoC like domain
LVKREDIKRFASEFDPQPYHLDEMAAERTPLKGLAASGWYTAAIAMRLIVDARPLGPHPLLGAGVDQLRWLARCAPAMSSTSKARWLSSHHQRRSQREMHGSNGQLSISMVSPCTLSLRSFWCHVARADKPNEARTRPSIQIGSTYRWCAQAKLTDKNDFPCH